MNRYGSRPRSRVVCIVGMFFMFAVVAFTGVSPAKAETPWNVELSAGVVDGISFGTVHFDYGITLGSLMLAPGVSGSVFSGAALEANANLRGAYPLHDWLTFEFAIERGLGLVGDVYCHQRWQVGIGAAFGATQVSIAKGASARTVWGCGDNFSDFTSVAVKYKVSARHHLGVRIDSPGEVGFSVGWRF